MQIYTPLPQAKKEKAYRGRIEEVLQKQKAIAQAEWKAERVGQALSF